MVISVTHLLVWMVLISYQYSLVKLVNDLVSYNVEYNFFFNLTECKAGKKNL